MTNDGSVYAPLTFLKASLLHSSSPLLGGFRVTLDLNLLDQAMGGGAIVLFSLLGATSWRRFLLEASGGGSVWHMLHRHMRVSTVWRRGLGCWRMLIDACGVVPPSIVLAALMGGMARSMC
jgi:hypothetical protein